MPTLFERLREYWISEGLSVRPGVSHEEIRAFESRYGVSLPSDLWDYFATVNGRPLAEFDEEMLAFLPLGDIKSVPEELAEYKGCPDYANILDTLPDADRYFVFADWMCTSRVYAIQLSDDASQETPVIAISGGDDDDFWRIAASFTEFIEKYLTQGGDALPWES